LLRFATTADTHHDTWANHCNWLQ